MKNFIDKLTICTLLFLVTSFSACEKFLDEPISKNSSIPLESIEHLNALMEQYGSLYSDENPSWMGTDDYGLNAQTYDNKRGNFTFLPNIFRAFWDIEYNKLTANSDALWASGSGEWRDVFYANAVLENLNKVTGGTEADRARLKAEAHLLRAYAYWQLANTYCLPYTNTNKSEMGLPIKKSTSFEEDLTRVSLEETYKFIESDLAEALKINKPLLVGGKT